MSKLVRDNIPEIIKNNEGNEPETRILEQKEYVSRLREKLREEVNEYLADPRLEELADITEVVEALAEIGGGMGKMRKIKGKKKRERGGFEKRVLLMV